MQKSDFKFLLAMVLAFVLAFEAIEGFDDFTEWKKIKNGFNTVQLVSGVYKGNIVSRNFDGVGEYILNTGSSYNGTWSSSAPEGDGTLKIASLGTYNGEFKNGKREGQGTFTWLNDEHVDGTWSDDKLDGNFTLNRNDYVYSCSTNEDGEYLLKELIYNGDGYTVTWNFDGIELNDFSSEILSETTANFEYNGTTISGYISEGNFNGECTVSFSNGDYYTGNLTNGVREGQGTYKWSSDGSNAEYSGSWSNDMMNGEGIYYYEGKPWLGNGFNYLEGEFLNNYPNGVCICHRLITGDAYSDNINGTWETTWENGVCISIERK